MVHEKKAVLRKKARGLRPRALQEWRHTLLSNWRYYCCPRLPDLPIMIQSRWCNRPVANMWHDVRLRTWLSPWADGFRVSRRIENLNSLKSKSLMHWKQANGLISTGSRAEVQDIKTTVWITWPRPQQGVTSTIANIFKLRKGIVKYSHIKRTTYIESGHFMLTDKKQN